MFPRPAPVLLLLLTLAVPRLTAQDLPGEPAYGTLTLDTPSATIPFVRAGPQIVVEGVRVDGQGPFRFLLDTGAQGGGRLDVSLVERLGLQPTGEIRVGDGSGRDAGTLPLYTVGTLAFGPLRYEDVVVVARDDNVPQAASLRGPIDGVLGIGLFAELRLTLDGPGALLTVDTQTLDPGGRGCLPLAGDRGVPTIDITVDGQPVTAHIDTGHAGGLALPGEFADSLRFAAPPEVMGRARTVAGEFEILGGRLEGDLRVGGLVLHQPEVVIAPPFPDANLGAEVLLDAVTVLDQPHGLARVLSPAGHATEVLLSRMHGRCAVQARLLGARGEAPRPFAGEAEWTRAHGGRYLHEQFQLTVDGQRLTGEVFLDTRPARGGLTLVQLDDFNPSMLHVEGTWDDDEHALVMLASRAPDETGPPRLRWVYRADPEREDAWIKEMQVPTADGGWRLASTYRYLPEG